MNTKRMKKIATMLGLSAALAFSSVTNTYADSAKESTEETIEENNEWKGFVYTTDSYFLIRLDGKIYLTTTSKYRDDDIGDRNRLLKVTDVKSGNFVGFYSVPCNYNSKYLDNEDGDLIANKYVKGYGYKNLIPFPAIVSLKAFVDSEYPSRSDLLFFTSDSKELHNVFEKELVRSNINQKGYVYYRDGESFFGPCYSYYIHSNVYSLLEYDLKNEDQEIRGIGYRTSIYKSDVGYNYIYDIVSGKIVYVGTNRDDGYEVISIKERKEEKSISEWKEYLKPVQKVDKQKAVPVKEQNVYNAKEIFVYDLEKLRVLYGIEKNSTSFKNESIDYTAPYDSNKYHFLKNTYTNKNLRNFENVYDNCLMGIISVTSDIDHKSVIVDGFIENVMIYDTNYQFFFKPIHQFLEEKGLSDLQKEKYTQQELDEIYQYLNQEKLTLSLENN